LLTLDMAGTVVETSAPPTFVASEFSTEVSGNSCLPKSVQVPSTPTTAWRTLDVPGQGVVMLHQRAREGEVQITPGGYGSGGGGCSTGIVHSSLTVNADKPTARSADLMNASLPVDIAADTNGTWLAAITPGNWGTGFPQLEVFSLASAGQWAEDVTSDQRGCAAPNTVVDIPTGQGTAVSFVTPEIIAVQEREPAGITFVNTSSGLVTGRLDLKQESRYDTGHTLFHTRTSAGVACAACHAEGGDDSHVWTFKDIGARRTQQLRGGILGSEPFHWNGDMKDFPTLVEEVFVGRMQAGKPLPEQTMALANWIDRLPAYKVTAADPAAAERGKRLFESEAVGCASCHSGSLLTNNQSFDVGTGVTVQVPSLHDVALRTPLMHNGCAATLLERFTLPKCGGGEKHGRTSHLTDSELRDLVSYVSIL
jgi:mono/diheme cytochrome c family protein